MSSRSFRQHSVSYRSTQNIAINCKSRYDTGRQITFFEKNDGSLINFIQDSLKGPVLSKNAQVTKNQANIALSLQYLLSKVDPKYSIQFFLEAPSRGTSKIVPSLIKMPPSQCIKDRTDNNKICTLWTKPVLIERNKQLIYFVEISAQYSPEKLRSILLVLAVLSSHLLIYNCYPLKPDQLSQSLSIFSVFQEKCSDDIQELAEYFPQLVVLLLADSLQDYSTRSHNLDESILQNYLNTKSKIKQSTKDQYIKKRDCIVMHKESEKLQESSVQLEYLRVKILKTRAKPSHYTNLFLFNSQQTLIFLEKALQTFSNSKDYAISLKAISKQTTQQPHELHLKTNFTHCTHEDVYKTWATQLESFYQTRILQVLGANQESKNKFKQLINQFNGELKKKIDSYHSRNVSEKSSHVVMEAQRLIKIIKQLVSEEGKEVNISLREISTHLCIACGLKYEDVKYYVESGQRELSNLSMSSVHLQIVENGNMPIQSKISGESNHQN